MSAPQYCNRANISHNNQKFGHSLRPQFFFHGGHGKRKILMDSHPYSHVTSLFTLGAPHEGVQGRQTKLHPGFTMGKLVQPSPGISILQDAHIVLSNRSEWCPPELPHTCHRAVDIVYFHFLHFFTKILKWHLRKKNYQKGPQHACSTYLFKHVATIMQ